MQRRYVVNVKAKFCFVNIKNTTDEEIIGSDFHNNHTWLMYGTQ